MTYTYVQVWKPIHYPTELCYFTKRETNKAQSYLVERFIISKTCSLYFLLGVRLDICIKVKVSHSLLAVEAVGVRVPLYFGHS